MNEIEPPTNEELDLLLEQTRREVMRHVAAGRSARRRRRIRMVGFVLAAVLGLGGVTAATAAKFWVREDAPRTVTTFISLGEAPADSRVVDVKVRYVCEPGVRFDFGINPSAKFTGLRDSGVICSRDGARKPAKQTVAFDLCTRVKPDTEFFLAVSTDSDRPVRATAKFAAGPSLQERYDPDYKGDDGGIPLPTQCVDHSVPVDRPSKEPSDDPWNHPAVWPEPYYVNENGMTIGMWTMNTPDREVPDLWPATGTHGEKGFMSVRKPWLVWPDELEAENKRLGIRTDAKGREFAPLLAIDGVTRIGWVRQN